MKKVTCVFMLIVSFFAQSEEDPCNSANGGAYAGALCVQQKMQVADKQLNSSYQEAIKRIKEEDEFLLNLRPHIRESELLESSFREAQRAWLKFRDKQCEFQGKQLTRSPWQSVQIEHCKLRLTVERVEYFKKVLVG